MDSTQVIINNIQQVLKECFELREANKDLLIQNKELEVDNNKFNAENDQLRRFIRSTRKRLQMEKRVNKALQHRVKQLEQALFATQDIVATQDRLIKLITENVDTDMIDK